MLSDSWSSIWFHFNDFVHDLSVSDGQTFTIQDPRGVSPFSSREYPRLSNVAEFRPEHDSNVRLTVDPRELSAVCGRLEEGGREFRAVEVIVMKEMGKEGGAVV